MFNILWNCKTIFHSAWTILHSNQECKRVLIPSKPQQQLLFSFFIYIFLILRECVCVCKQQEGQRQREKENLMAWTHLHGAQFGDGSMTLRL